MRFRASASVILVTAISLGWMGVPGHATAATSPQSDSRVIVEKTPLAGTDFSYALTADDQAGQLKVELCTDVSGRAARVRALYRFQLSDGTAVTVRPERDVMFVFPKVASSSQTGLAPLLTGGCGYARFASPGDVTDMTITPLDVQWLTINDPKAYARTAGGQPWSLNFERGGDKVSWWLDKTNTIGPWEVTGVGYSWGYDGDRSNWVPWKVDVTPTRAKQVFTLPQDVDPAAGFHIELSVWLSGDAIARYFTPVVRTAPPGPPSQPTSSAPCRTVLDVRVCSARFEDESHGDWRAMPPVAIRGAGGQIVVDGGAVESANETLEGGGRTSIVDGTSLIPVALGPIDVAAATGIWSSVVPDPTALLDIAGVKPSGIRLTKVGGNVSTGEIDAEASLDLHGLGIPAVAEFELSWLPGQGWSGRLTEPLKVPLAGGTLTLSGGEIAGGAITASGRIEFAPGLALGSVEVKDVRISSRGIELAGYGGTIRIPDLVLPGKVGLTDAEVSLTSDPTLGLLLEGSATFTAPFLARRGGTDAAVTVSLALAPRDPIVHRAELTFKGSIPLGSTGMVITELRGKYVVDPTTVSGGLSIGSAVDLPEIGRPVSATVDASLRLGPATADPHLGGGVTDWEGRADGTASVFSWEVARAHAVLGPGGFWTSADFAIGPARGAGEVRIVDRAGAPLLSGSAALGIVIPRGSVHVLLFDGPPDDVRLAEVSARLGNFRHAGTIEYGASAQAKVLFVGIGIFVGADGTMDVNANLDEYQLETAAAGSVQLALFRAGAGGSGHTNGAPALVTRTFVVAPGTPSILVGARWQGAGRLVVTTPSGDRLELTSMDWATFSRTAGSESVAVADPVPGRWSVAVEGGAGVDLVAARSRDPLTVRVDAPNARVKSDGQRPVEISWSATRGNVSLSIDTDAAGFDGQVIAADLPAAGTYSWTPAVPNGNYRIYAIADDGVVTAADYGPAVIEIDDVTPPPQPAAPHLSATADGFAATWAPVPDAVNYQLSVAAGDSRLTFDAQDLTELSVAAGLGTYSVAVIATDSNGRATTGASTPIVVVEVPATPELRQQAGTSILTASGGVSGARIVLQRSNGEAWDVVEAATARPDGTTEFTVANEAATYRVAVSGLLTPLAYSDELAFDRTVEATPTPGAALETPPGPGQTGGGGQGPWIAVVVAFAVLAGLLFRARRQVGHWVRRVGAGPRQSS